MHYYEALDYGDVIKYSLSTVLALFLIVLLIVFFRYLFSKEQNFHKKQASFRLSIKVLKHISLLSILVGTLGTIILTQRIMIKIGIGGPARLDAVAGPLADALSPIIFGLLNASVGFFFYFFAKWRNIRAIKSIEES